MLAYSGVARLFLWPASLSADYTPPRISPRTAFDASLIPHLLLVALPAIAVAMRKRNTADVCIGLDWNHVTDTKQSPVVTGNALAERAMFLPSVVVAMMLDSR